MCPNREKHQHGRAAIHDHAGVAAGSRFGLLSGSKKQMFQRVVKVAWAVSRQSCIRRVRGDQQRVSDAERAEQQKSNRNFIRVRDRRGEKVSLWGEARFD